MGLCIGVLEDDLREAVNDIDKDKFVYKFLSDTDKYDMYLEELGVKTITDCVIFSGVMNDVRQLRYKKPGREATEGWRQVVNKIFDTNDKPVRVEENKGEDVSKSNVEIVNELFASNQSKVDI